MFGPRVPDPDPGPNQVLKVAFLPQNLNEIDLKRNAYTFELCGRKATVIRTREVYKNYLGNPQSQLRNQGTQTVLQIENKDKSLQTHNLLQIPPRTTVCP